MDETLNQPPEITCQEVLYRAAFSKRHISPEGHVSEGMFLLRPTDDGQLSVFRRELVSLAGINEALFSHKPKRFVTLHAGRVRDASMLLNRRIDVTPDEIPEVRGHAVITGLPDYALERAAAEFAAGVLRDQCRLAIADSESSPPAVRS